MADNLFAPFHRSYRLTLTQAVLLGGFMILSYTLWRDLQACRQDARLCCTTAQELENQVPFLEAENSALQRKYQQVLRDNDALQGSITNLENQVGELINKVEFAVSQNQTAQDTIAGLTGELAEAQAAITVLENERQQLTEEIDGLETRVRIEMALPDAAAWLSRRWQVTSALLFAGMVAPAALLRRKVRKLHNRAAKRLHERHSDANSTWMLVRRSEAKAISQQRRVH